MFNHIYSTGIAQVFLLKRMVFFMVAFGRGVHLSCQCWNREGGRGWGKTVCKHRQVGPEKRVLWVCGALKKVLSLQREGGGFSCYLTKAAFMVYVCKCV